MPIYPVRMVKSGIAYDMPPAFLADPIFSAGRNFVFRDGLPEKVGGAGAFLPDFDNDVFHLLSVRSDAYDWWIAAGAETVEVGNRTNKYDITPAATLDVCDYNEWTSCILGGVPILNNKYNDPIYWDLNTSNPMETLPDWPTGTKCKALRAHKYHLIAMNISDPGGDFGSSILWSDAAEPGSVPSSWTPSTSNEAGSAGLSQTPGVIVDGLSLGDQFLIYKEASMYAMQYVGGNKVFSIRPVLTTTGAISRNAIIEHERMHMVLTDSDVVLTDGSDAKSIIDGSNRKWLFSQISTEFFANSYMVKDYKQNEIWLCFPVQGYQTPTLALVYSADTGSWGVRELPLQPPHIASGSSVNTLDTKTYDDSSADAYDVTGKVYNSTGLAATLPIMASAKKDSASTYMVDDGLTIDGASVIGYLHKYDLTFGDTSRKKQVNRVWVQADGTPGAILQIRVGGRDNPHHPIKWGYESRFRVGIDQKVDACTNARYISIEIKNSWADFVRLHGVDFDYQVTGEF